MPEGGSSMPQRIRSLDLIRVVSFLMIIWYHMTVQLPLCGICRVETVSPFYSSANLHLGTMAVAAFFMLSGAGLYISSQKDFNALSFYRKRLPKLLIPYYIVVAVVDALKIISERSLQAVFDPEVPAWRFVFTLCGMDEWVSMHGIKTFSNTVGEWFLGALIIIYLLFPLIKTAYDRIPKLFFFVSTAVYLYFIYHYSLGIQIHMSLLTKLYEFILGIYTAKNLKHITAHPYWLLTLPVILYAALSGRSLDMNPALKITVTAAAFFISFLYLEKYIPKADIIQKISSLSYEVYLVHHVIIYRLTPMFAPHIAGSRLMVLVLFSAELVCMVIAGLVLKKITTIKKL